MPAPPRVRPGGLRERSRIRPPPAHPFSRTMVEGSGPFRPGVAGAYRAFALLEPPATAFGHEDGDEDRASSSVG